MLPYALLSAGSNAQGQLATGDSEDAHTFTPCLFMGCSPGTLPAGIRHIASLACGANHTLLLLERANASSSSPVVELWGCGDGRQGQLGPSVASNTVQFQSLNLPLDRLGLNGYTYREVAACWETSYVALRSPGGDDILLSFGADDFGDLGIGGAKAKGKQIDVPVHIVDLRSALADRDRPGPMQIRVLSIAAGPHHVAVSLSASFLDGFSQDCLVGWGASRHGQLGEWTDMQKGRPMPFLSSPRIIPQQGPERPSVVAAGTHHTAMLHANGTIQVLGSNRKKQLSGLGDMTGVSNISCTWNGTYAVVGRADQWKIASTGDHSRGQLGRQVVDGGSDAHVPTAVEFPFSPETHALKKVACGSEHILCLFETGREPGQFPRTEVWGWGWNEHGNLGIGAVIDQHLPMKLWPPAEHDQPLAADIWAGCGTSWIALGYS